ncbi:MAG: hypothetical protein PHQ14_00865, partial [Chromatiales bacterium]|nr:hypothetical protein [Chromatiales bacterium]
LPPHCPFCLPAGPARLIEVFAEDPVRYSAEPVLIEGSLKLLPKDDTGMLYRMTKAREVGR